MMFVFFKISDYDHAKGFARERGELYDFSSTYAYVVNSPLIYIDPDGMKINFAEMLNQKDGLNTVCKLLLDLAEQTGLSLSLSFNSEGSFLDYEKDGDGNAIISKDEEYGHNKGSPATARILSCG